MGKRVDRETPIQRGIVSYLRKVMPEAIVHHSPGESHLKGRAAMLATQRKKDDGMVPGFPDIVVFPYANVGAFFFEVKAPKSYASKRQKALHADLEQLGYPVAVVRSIDDVKECLRKWNVGTREVTPK